MPLQKIDIVTYMLLRAFIYILCDNKPVGIMSVGDVDGESIEIKNDIGLDDSFYELHGIYLHPDYYRKGIGTVAMDFAFEKAKSANKTNILLWVFEENISSINLYKKCGFVADAASKIYNCGKDMKCIRMRKSLSADIRNGNQISKIDCAIFEL